MTYSQWNRIRLNVVNYIFRRYLIKLNLIGLIVIGISRINLEFQKVIKQEET